MAKRRKKYTVRRAAPRRAAYTRRRKSNSTRDLTGAVIGAMAYGAIREKASNMLLPITSKVPLGNIADEAVLGTASYFIVKKSKNKTLKNIAMAGLILESARVGEAVANGQLGIMQKSNGQQSVF